MKRYNFHLDTETLAFLKDIQARTGVTVSEQIRRAIDRHIRESPAGRRKQAQELAEAHG